MARYIDADKLVNRLDEHYTTLGKKYGFDDMYVRGYGEAINDMEDEQSDVNAQEIKRAKWEMVGNYKVECTNCHHIRDIRTQCGWNFCPTCGAKFNLEETNG